MKPLALIAIAHLTALSASAARAQAPTYPPLREYMMPRDSEIAMARSAAPGNIASRATVEVLTPMGYTRAHDGDNGFVCVVMRGWAAPTYTPAPFRNFVYDASIRAPICFDPIAAKSVLPYYELRSTLGMAGKAPEQIARSVQAAYDTGKLPKRAPVSFAYMWSPHQMLGRGIGQWHPHMMVFVPFFENATLGSNPLGGPAPEVTDDGGTPFAVVVIPVDYGFEK
jgi:hypothetical protein